MVACMYRRMVVLHQRPAVGSSGEGSSSGSGSEPADERLRVFIASEITRGILELTPIGVFIITSGQCYCEFTNACSAYAYRIMLIQLCIFNSGNYSVVVTILIMVNICWKI